jgi:hypothetical protein
VPLAASGESVREGLTSEEGFECAQQRHAPTESKVAEIQRVRASLLLNSGLP